jgi:hypothetical protein
MNRQQGGDAEQGEQAEWICEGEHGNSEKIIQPQMNADLRRWKTG